MRKRFAVIGIICGLVLTHSALSDQISPEDERGASEFPSSIVVSVVSDRTTYRAGDDVKIEVFLKNTSAYALAAVFYAPWYDVGLKVTDADGNNVGPNLVPRHPPMSGSIHPWPIAPGEQILAWKHVGPISDVSQYIDGAGFVSTRNWGYIFDKPGRYRLSAIRYFRNAQTQPSNPLWITVTGG